MVLGNSRYLIYGSSWNILLLVGLVLMTAMQLSCPDAPSLTVNDGPFGPCKLVGPLDEVPADTCSTSLWSAGWKSSCSGTLTCPVQEFWNPVLTCKIALHGVIFTIKFSVQLIADEILEGA